jgi:hypothetical protein
MKKHLCEKDYVLIIVQIGYLLLFLRTFFFTLVLYMFIPLKDCVSIIVTI